jgi:hydrogenase nickel incorporation protein HypA/HybF
MHELSLLSDIINKIQSISRENGGAAITRARIRLGALSHISAEHFRKHFYQAVPGTAAANSELEIIEAKDIDDPRAQDIILESVDLAE